MLYPQPYTFVTKKGLLLYSKRIHLSMSGVDESTDQIFQDERVEHGTTVVAPTCIDGTCSEPLGCVRRGVCLQDILFQQRIFSRCLNLNGLKRYGPAGLHIVPAEPNFSYETFTERKSFRSREIIISKLKKFEKHLPTKHSKIQLSLSGMYWQLPPPPPNFFLFRFRHDAHDDM